MTRFLYHEVIKSPNCEGVAIGLVAGTKANLVLVSVRLKMC